eukprot:scaffold17682_cov113-Isochrysis_galbana.AAC.7
MPNKCEPREHVLRPCNNPGANRRMIAFRHGLEVQQLRQDLLVWVSQDGDEVGAATAVALVASAKSRHPLVASSGCPSSRMSRGTPELPPASGHTGAESGQACPTHDHPEK